MVKLGDGTCQCDVCGGKLVAVNDAEKKPDESDKGKDVCGVCLAKKRNKPIREKIEADIGKAPDIVIADVMESFEKEHPSIWEGEENVYETFCEWWNEQTSEGSVPEPVVPEPVAPIEPMPDPEPKSKKKPSKSSKKKKSKK